MLSSKLEEILTQGLAALLLVICVSKFGSSLTHTLQCPDTAWLIKTGQYIIEHGLPATDPFSFTCQNRAIVIYQWLFAILLANLWQQGGLWLVALATSVVVALLYLWLLPATMLSQAVKPVYVFGLLSLICTPVWFWARPQLASFILIILFIAVLERSRQDKIKLLWSLPLLMVLWANLHSFWFIGLFMVAAYLIEAVIQNQRASSKALGLTLGACILAVLINPYGWGLVQYNLSFTTEPDFGSIRELQPVLITHAKYFLNVLLYLLLAWCAILFGRRSVPLSGLILASGGTAAALLFYRFTPVAILLTWPYVALALAKFSFSKSDDITVRKKQLISGLPLLAISCALFYFLQQFPAGKPVWFTNSDTNLETTMFLKKHPELTKRLLCDPSVGCSLIFENILPVFIDTRFDFYGRQFCSEFNNCFNAEAGWQQYIEKWQVDALCIDDTYPIYRALLSAPNWLLAFDDGHFSVWVPNSKKGYQLCQSLLANLSEQQRQLMRKNFSEKHASTAVAYKSKGQQQLALQEFKQGLKWSPEGSLKLFLQRNYDRLYNETTRGSAPHEIGK